VFLRSVFKLKDPAADIVPRTLFAPLSPSFFSLSDEMNRWLKKIENEKVQKSPRASASGVRDLGAPASSADNERAFSSASFTMDNHRYMIDIETFRKEHRVRRFLVSGNDTHSREGRQGRLDKLNRILEGYDSIVNVRINAEENHSVFNVLDKI
jgi:hypothetical protein